MMHRVPNWEIELVRYARSIAGKPFIWGETDCACVVLMCIDAMHCTDTRRHVIGLYGSPEAAYRQQERGDGLIDILRRIGAEMIGCACKSTRGDILTARRDRFICGHVVIGKECISSDPEHGVVLVKTLDVARCDHVTAWRT